MKRNTVLTIAKKEFFGYVNSPLAYTIIVPFLLLSTFLYTRTAFATGEASLRPYFDLLPWFLLLLAPALSMKLLPDEFKNNTLELMFAHPVSEAEIVAGKFLGALTFYGVILFTTIGLPFTVLSYSKADPGIIAGQYIGAFFVGAAFLALGIGASSYVKNAISSFLLAAAIGFTLIIIGLDFITMMLLPPFNLAASDLSVLNRAENFARGLLDIRDLFYFITLIGLALLFAIMKLSERKLIEEPTEKRKLYTAFGLLIAIGIISNVLLTSYPLRLDLTDSRLFSLSAGTTQTLKNLPDIVNAKIYTTKTLPSEMQTVLRQVTDTLKDYQKINGKFKVETVYPEEDQDAAADAQTNGIQQVQFNKMGSDKFEVQNGYLGLTIRYGDKTETIPFISDTSDLEYQVTRRIRKLTQEKEMPVGLYVNGQTQNQILQQLLETQYTIKQIAPGDTGSLKDVRALIVIDDGNLEGTSSAFISDYLHNKGKVLFLGSGVGVNMQSLTAEKSKSIVPEFLADYGIKINNDLVYDLQLNELLTFGSGNQRYIAPYPYWIKALPADEKFAPMIGIKSISLGWPSSIKIEKKNGITYKNLLKTSDKGGKTEGTFTLNPQELTGLTPSGEQILAVAAEKGEERLIIVGSFMLAEDRFLSNNRDNLAFLSNSIDYLATDKDLAAIPAKTGGRAVFVFKNPSDLVFVQYGNLIAPSLAVIVFAVYYLRRRKLLAQRVYQKE